MSTPRITITKAPILLTMIFSPNIYTAVKSNDSHHLYPSNFKMRVSARLKQVLGKAN
ncbi:hypothetical protein GCM10007931_31430 [Vibrio algivorus]|uniref:Uncharacterized protein n=1 Tax=Vibrio algivorus TaxID=1667024 RepID=A0ABQ6EUD7_9VIBR|nr:hypothetical protein GCM10007931_31430 [Vibrio algivorus]